MVLGKFYNKESLIQVHAEAIRKQVLGFEFCPLAATERSRLDASVSTGALKRQRNLKR